MYVHRYSHTYAHLHIHAHTRAHTHTHTHTHIHTIVILKAVITKTVRVKISCFKLALLKATYLLVKICLIVSAAIATTASKEFKAFVCNYKTLHHYPGLQPSTLLTFITCYSFYSVSSHCTPI